MPVFLLTRLVRKMRKRNPEKKPNKTIQDLPEDETCNDVMERLYFLAKVERGLAESKHGRTFSHDEIKITFFEAGPVIRTPRFSISTVVIILRVLQCHGT